MKTTRKKRKVEAPQVSPVRLVHVPAAVDADGEPRVALEVLPHAGSVSRRPTLLMFASMAMALSAKREMEAAR